MRPASEIRRRVRPGAIVSGVLAVTLGALTLAAPDDSASQIASGAGAVAAALGTAWLWLRR